MTPTRRAAPAARLRRRARRRLDAVRATADARWGRPREGHRPVYLVAPAGHPNHGDEQLLAGWLRYLRHALPNIVAATLTALLASAQVALPA